MVWSAGRTPGLATTQLAKYDATTKAWTAPVNLADDTSSAGICADAAGNLLLVWGRGIRTVQAVRWGAGAGTWSAPVDVSAPLNTLNHSSWPWSRRAATPW